MPVSRPRNENLARTRSLTIVTIARESRSRRSARIEIADRFSLSLSRGVTKHWIARPRARAKIKISECRGRRLAACTRIRLAERILRPIANRWDIRSTRTTFPLGGARARAESSLRVPRPRRRNGYRLSYLLSRLMGPGASRGTWPRQFFTRGQVPETPFDSRLLGLFEVSAAGARLVPKSRIPRRSSLSLSLSI